MKQGRTILLLLTGIYLLSEIIFSYVAITLGEEDLFGSLFKVSFFLVLIILFSKKLNWAKWVLSVLLILHGLLSLVAGFELGVIFYITGLYDIFFGVYIHISEALGVFRVDTFESSETSEPTRQKEAIPAEVERYRYPSLVTRYKALMIDGILIFTVLIAIMYLAGDSDLRTPIMLTSGAILLLSYEPVLTAYSRTIGQRVMKIRVGRHTNPFERISLLNAYIRWFTKGLLGWVSFISISFNPERRAIHDFVSDSVMIDDSSSSAQKSLNG